MPCLPCDAGLAYFIAADDQAATCKISSLESFIKALPALWHFHLPLTLNDKCGIGLDCLPVATTSPVCTRQPLRMGTRLTRC